MSIEKMAERVASGDLATELTRAFNLHERMSDIVSAIIEAVHNNVDATEAEGADPEVVEKMQEQASLVAQALDGVLAKVDMLDDEIAAM